MSMTKTWVNDITSTSRIQAVDCSNCGITFGLSVEYIARRREDKRSFYCPNGHSQYFPGRTEAQRLARELDAAGTRETHLRDQLAAADHSRRAYKGQVTRIKRRVGRGVCPCCNRTFQDLGRHMAGQHPDYAAAEVTA